MTTPSLHQKHAHNNRNQNQPHDTTDTNTNTRNTNTTTHTRNHQQQHQNHRQLRSAAAPPQHSHKITTSNEPEDYLEEEEEEEEESGMVMPQLPGTQYGADVNGLASTIAHAVMPKQDPNAPLFTADQERNIRSILEECPTPDDNSTPNPNEDMNDANAMTAVATTSVTSHPSPSSHAQQLTTAEEMKALKPGSEEWEKKRRANHKEVERRRRENINLGISELFKVVPGCDKNKGSIVQRAVQYIRQLRDAEATNVEKWTLEKLLADQACAELTTQLSNHKTETEVLRRELALVRRENAKLQGLPLTASMSPPPLNSPDLHHAKDEDERADDLAVNFGGDHHIATGTEIEADEPEGSVSATAAATVAHAAPSHAREDVAPVEGAHKKKRKMK